MQNEPGYTSIKVKKSVADILKRDGIKCGSYASTIESLTKSIGYTIEPSTVKALEAKFGVSADNLDEFIKSYLIDDKETRIKALGVDGREVYTATGNIKKAETTDKLCKAIIQPDGKTSLNVLGALVQKIVVDAAIKGK